jgi:hypothetical protein
MAIVALPPILYLFAYINLVDGVTAVGCVGQPPNVSAGPIVVSEQTR